MTELNLFDNRGRFTALPPDQLDSLSAVRRPLYDAVADAARELEQIDADLAAATDAVRSAMDAVSEAEKQTASHKQSFHDLWLETFGRQRATSPALR